MAKRRTRARSRSAPVVVRAPSAPQVITVRAPSAVVRRSGGGGRRRRHHGGHGRSLTTETLFAAAMGGALMGFVDNAIGNRLPTIPMLGRAGTIALGCYLFSRGKATGMLRDIGLAASAVAGYEIGTKGSVSGIAPQVSGRGIAAQV